MEFVNPAFLAGGLLAAVPIILHLVMRRRPKLLEFPALRFVKLRETSNRRTLNLRHLLLLLARVAAIVFLALALARPTSKLFGMLGDEEGPVTAVLVFDTSPRMAYKSDGKTRLAAAQEFAGKLLDKLPDQSQVSVINTRSTRRSLDDSPALARHRVAALQIAQSVVSLSVACEGAVEQLRDAKYGRKEMYVFTDFSAAAWPEKGAAPWVQRAIESGVAKIQFIDVGATDPANIALGKLTLSDEIVYENRPVIVTCSATKVGKPAPAMAKLRVMPPDGALIERSATLNVADGQTQELGFSLGGLDKNGVYQGELRIDGGDDLADDDVRYFTFEVRSRRRLLVAAPEPIAQRSIYFTEAVAGRVLQIQDLAPYEIAVVSYDQLPAQSLPSFAAVVLLDPPELAGQTWQQLDAYVRGGGGLVMFLGPGAHPESLNGEFAQAVVAGPISTLARFPQGDLFLWPDPDRHPLLAEFGPIQFGVPWEDFPVYCYWRLEPVAGAMLVAPYNNDAPAIVERSIGRGKAITVTTPISEPSATAESDRWNLLPIGPKPWPYVMLVNGIVNHLVGNQGALNHPTRKPIVLQLDPLKRFTHYLVKREDLPTESHGVTDENASAGPPQDESFRVTADLDRNQLRLPRLMKAGNYRVQAGAQADGVDRGLSVNWPDEANAMLRIDDARRQELLGDAPHHVAKEIAEVTREANPDRRGRDLYPILICLIAGVLGFEHVLANRFYRRG